jgi:Zn-finger protein
MMGLEQLVMQPDDVEEKRVKDRSRGKVVWSCKPSHTCHEHIRVAENNRLFPAGPTNIHQSGKAVLAPQ